jgi:hypothetical protein
MLSLGIYPVIVNLALSTAARSPHGITETKIKNYAIKMFLPIFHVKMAQTARITQIAMNACA